MWKKLILIFLLTIFNCCTFANAQTSPIVIGALYNFSGAQSLLDDFSVNGAKLAIDEINAAGGVLGRPLQLVIQDGETQAEIVKKAATTLANDKDIVAVVGLSDTDMALDAIPVLRAHKKLFITSGATSPQLPNAAPGWVFLGCFSDNKQAQAGADFAYQTLGKTALVITQDDNSYAKLLHQYFQPEYTKLGGKIIAELQFNHQNSELSQKLRALKNSGVNPDVIYVAAGPQMGLKMVAQLREAGFKQPILGGDAFDSEELDKQPREQIGTLYFTTHAFVDRLNPKPNVQRFITAYQNAYQQLPDSSFAGLGYDVVHLLAQAITQANSTDPEKIRAALMHMQNFEGVTGRSDYENSYIPNKDITIMRFDKGKRELVKELRG